MSGFVPVIYWTTPTTCTQTDTLVTNLPLMHTSLHQLIRDGDVAQINLALAVEHASESSKEAPWYGAWALLLRKLEDYIVHDNQSGITTTIFFPQHPLTAEFAELEEMVDLPPNPSFPHQEDVINIDDEGNDLDPNVGLINMGMEDIHEPGTFHNCPTPFIY